MGGTLYAAMGMHSYILTIVCCGAQVHIIQWQSHPLSISRQSTRLTWHGTRLHSSGRQSMAKGCKQVIRQGDACIYIVPFSAHENCIPGNIHA